MLKRVTIHSLEITWLFNDSLLYIRLSWKVSFFYRHVFYNDASLYKHET